MYTLLNPATGDSGINPIVLILFFVCAVIIVGCIIWAIVLSRKNSKIETTVVTVTDDELDDDETIVEDFDTEDFDETDANDDVDETDF